MKTGLTKKQKTTSIFFTEADDWIEVSTYNTDLKNRLSEFALNYPRECRMTEDDEAGSMTFEIRRGRFGFRLTPPYSDDRRNAARAAGKKRVNNLKNHNTES